MVSISTRVGKRKIEEPVMLASGILDETSGSILRSLESGAGISVTKSIGTEERKGYSTPIVSVIKTGMLNAVGLANPGIDAFLEEFTEVEKKDRIAVSIFGKDSEEFSYLAKRVEEAGFGIVELNLSCPHVQGFGSEVGQDPELVEDIIAEIRGKTNLQIWAKLTPNVTDLIEIARAAEKADAYVLINTLKATGVDIYSRNFLLSNKIGGYSGPGIKPVALRAVYDVFRETGKDIIGVGGITDWSDAIEFFLLGAKAVQVGTGIYYEDYAIFRKINEGISNYLEQEKFSSLDEIIGLMVRK